MPDELRLLSSKVRLSINLKRDQDVERPRPMHTIPVRRWIPEEPEQRRQSWKEKLSSLYQKIKHMLNSK